LNNTLNESFPLRVTPTSSRASPTSMSISLQTCDRIPNRLAPAEHQLICPEINGVLEDYIDDVELVTMAYTSRNDAGTAASRNGTTPLSQESSRASSRMSAMDVSLEQAPLATSSRANSRNEPRPPSQNRPFDIQHTYPEGVQVSQHQVNPLRHPERAASSGIASQDLPRTNSSDDPWPVSRGPSRCHSLNNFRPISQCPSAAAPGLDAFAEAAPLATSSRPSSRNEHSRSNLGETQHFGEPSHPPNQFGTRVAQLQAAMAQTYRTLHDTPCLVPPFPHGPDSRPNSGLGSEELPRPESRSSQQSSSSSSSDDSLPWPPPSLQAEWDRESAEQERQRVSREQASNQIQLPTPFDVHVGDGQSASSGSGSGSSSIDVSGEEIPIPPSMYALQRQAMMASMQFCHHRMQGQPVLRQACFVCNGRGYQGYPR